MFVAAAAEEVFNEKGGAWRCRYNSILVDFSGSFEIESD